MSIPAMRFWTSRFGIWVWVNVAGDEGVNLDKFGLTALCHRFQFGFVGKYRLVFGGVEVGNWFNGNH